MENKDFAMRALVFFVCCFVFIDLTGQSNKLIDPRDGKVYNTVQIGKQIWMAQDLSTKTVEYECLGLRNKDTTLCGEYGTWYSWKIAKSACPVGWHLPSKEEFRKLLTNIGGDRKYQYKTLGYGEFKAFTRSGQKGSILLTSSGTERSPITFDFNAPFKFVGFAKHDRYSSKTLIGFVRCVRDSISP